MAIPILIDKTIPIYTSYFHAVSLSGTTGTTDIFNTDTKSFALTGRQHYEPYDVVDKIIKPLADKGVLRANGNTLLVKMEGMLVLPDPMVGKCPLVMIGHGNHDGYAKLNHTEHKPSQDMQGNIIKGKWLISVFDQEVESFRGYEGFQTAPPDSRIVDFQNTLAENGIVSYSINLNIVNDLDNNEHTGFEKIALDVNQRILLFFLHLKLLKIIAGEALDGDEFPIRFLEGTVFKNIKDALQTSTHTGLMGLKTALQGKIDFTKLGFMGHSRGADAVTRIPAYFFKGATLADPSFPVNEEVNRRIQSLSKQIGKPSQDSIKCILALEPVASVNEGKPSDHGYIIKSQHTMFFVGLGTHDEDVTFDPVRIYEHPSCPKAMIAINGASHFRFNNVWAAPWELAKKVPEILEEENKKLNLLSLKQHKEILSDVYGSCFTATLANQSSGFEWFTKAREFPIKLPNAIQCAWKFGFPLGNPIPVLKDLDDKITEPDSQNLEEPFEQHISAFLEKRENAGIFSLKIPINPASNEENLSKYTHFSFRFAKGFDLSTYPDRTEEKNFTIEFFENDNLVGKRIEGKDITKVQLKAIRATYPNEETGKAAFEHSILLQTVEISFSGRFSTAELDKVNRIEIKIIPDPTKSPPRPVTTVSRGTIGGALVGGAIGAGGGAIFNETKDPDEELKKWIIVGGGLGGVLAGGTIYNVFFRADKNAFAFKDFLLTNRQFP